jgi:hypothetical protein
MDIYIDMWRRSNSTHPTVSPPSAREELWYLVVRTNYSTDGLGIKGNIRCFLSHDSKVDDLGIDPFPHYE